ncbi:MAG: hypothetical protein H6822_25545 [Planctomycetaceae bacterium]|nr:hypothetical protein [Planctomycetaceae bacterium]
MNLKLADRLLLLSWKKLLLIPTAWVLCVILHNVIYGLFQSYFAPGGDEPFFFLLAVVVIPLYTVACLLYSIVRLSMWWASRSRTS